MIIRKTLTFMGKFLLRHPGGIRTLLGKSCEVEKMMRFLKKMEMFEEI